ncbi:MAG: TlpA family protein disulfide reductase [Cyclobacteriaceae bacterium]
MRFAFIFGLVLHSFLGTAQTHLFGRIRPSEDWRSILYVIRIDKLRLADPVLIDSIALDKSGVFDYTFPKDPRGLFYELRQPPVGGNHKSLVQVRNDDNWFHVISSSDKRTDVEINAYADSLYYSVRYSGDNANESLQIFRDLKRPIPKTLLEAADQIQANPSNATAIKEHMLSQLLDRLDSLRPQIMHVIDTCTNESVLAAALYYLNEAYLGKINVAIIQPYLSRFGESEVLLINNMKNLSKADRLGIILPDDVLLDPKGKELAFKSFQGVYKVIDFWASWCRPCRAANRVGLPELNESLKRKGIPLIGISIDEDRENWRKALAKDQTSWPQVVEKNRSFERLLRIGAVPHYLILDESDRVIFESTTHQEIKQKLEELLSGR